MTAYWSRCPGCTDCTVDGCDEVAYCDGTRGGHHIPHDAPDLCETHTYVQETP